MDFVAIDVETANADLASICSIGIVHFKDGAVAQRLGFLINPEDYFDPINTSIHGIRAEDVAHAGTMREEYPLVTAALITTTVVHHTHFDRVALCRSAARYGFPPPACTWLDTARVARRAWNQFAHAGYGLANLAAELGIEFKHHDAAEDARVAGLILLHAMLDTGLSLAEWLERVKKPLSGTDSRAGQFARAGNPDGILAGEVIVFTGSLQVPRRVAAEMAAQIGCDVGDRVTKDTTILVVGDQDIRRLRGHEKSAKHQKTEKLIRDGAKIRIVSETDFRGIVNGY
jgi:DNA polymerase III subunit epsilon